MSLGEKRGRVRYYQSQGLKLSLALETFGLSRHQYYHRPKLGADKRPSRSGCKPSTTTIHHNAQGVEKQCPNTQVIQAIESFQRDDDLRCRYKRMTAQLQLQGYQINHKKVYRLMRANDLLLSRLKRPDRLYMQHRRAMPREPLTLLEKDIKMIWIEEHRRYAFH